jgi:hypothetical protein
MKQPLDRLRSQKKPVTKPAWIALDSDLADQYMSAVEEAKKARAMSDLQPKTPHLAVKAQEAEDEVERLLPLVREGSAKFVAKSIGRQAFEDLQSAHPPTPDQRKDAKREGLGDLSFNPDTFPPALILASCYLAEADEETQEEVLYPLDDAFVKELWDGAGEDGEAQWNHAEVMGLFEACFSANSQRRILDLGNASRRTRS